MAGALFSALLGIVPGAPPQQPRRPLVVLGPEASGRSALLFRAALLGSSAAAAPASVMFLAPRPLHRLPCAGGLDAIAMQRIQFLYPPSSQLMFQVLANLQQTCCPTLVAVDGLEEYLSSCSGPNVAAQLVALLLDTVNHFSQKLSRVSSACQLLVSMKSPGEAGEDGGHFSVVERYFQAQMWLHPEAEESAAAPVSHGATKVVRARLSQPGYQDQEWLLRFEPEGKMKISLLPCKGEDSHGAAAQNDTPAGAKTQAAQASCFPSTGCGESGTPGEGFALLSAQNPRCVQLVGHCVIQNAGLDGLRPDSAWLFLCSYALMKA